MLNSNPRINNFMEEHTPVVGPGAASAVIAKRQSEAEGKENRKTHNKNISSNVNRVHSNHRLASGL